MGSGWGGGMSVMENAVAKGPPCHRHRLRAGGCSGRCPGPLTASPRDPTPPTPPARALARRQGSRQGRGGSAPPLPGDASDFVGDGGGGGRRGSPPTPVLQSNVWPLRCTDRVDRVISRPFCHLWLFSRLQISNRHLDQRWEGGREGEGGRPKGFGPFPPLRPDLRFAPRPSSRVSNRLWALRYHRTIEPEPDPFSPPLPSFPSLFPHC